MAFANGTGQPDTARMIAMLADHPRKPDYDLAKLADLRKYFTKIYEKLGFVRVGCIKNFFRDNYNHPIIENGVQLVDMIILQRRL